MTALGNEDSFRDWLRKTCQIKRRDHFENCYEHLQSLLKDPVILEMVQSRKEGTQKTAAKTSVPNTSTTNTSTSSSTQDSTIISIDNDDAIQSSVTKTKKGNTAILFVIVVLVAGLVWYLNQA